MSFENVAFNEVRYSASTVGCTMFVRLYKAFEQELGKERALPVLCKYGESMGRYYAQQLKAKVGDRVPTVKEMAEFMTPEWSNFGCKVSYEELTNGLKLRVENCPMAGAYAALGLDLDAGREVCTAFSSYMDAVMAQEVGWSFGVTDYRKDWNGACQEVLLVR
jgi:hypothetical protein